MDVKTPDVVSSTKDLLKMYDEAIKWSIGMTQYEVRPHPISADARPPQGPPAPATNGRAGRGGRGGGAQ